MIRPGYAVVTFALLAMFALGCAGIEEDSQGLFTETPAQQALEPNVSVPGYWGGVVPWEYEEDSIVVPVLAQSQDEVSAINSKSASSLGGIGFLEPDEGATKASSTLSDGRQYYACKNVAISEVNGVTFSPTGTTPAYAMYNLEAPADTPFSVGVAWYSLPDEMDSYFIGIGDSEMDVWHWYQGPDDGVLTFNPDEWSRPGTVGSNVLVCVALESGKPADFWQVNWGVPEVRGTGLSYEENAVVPQLPAQEGEKASSAALPADFSLRPNLPAISNQGSMGSCTAFACTDAGLNILLDRMYGDSGWDLTDDEIRTSPMWAYVKSGVSPIGNWNPLCGSSVGRYMSQAFNVLEQIGSATEATVPYQATSNCSTTFDSLATTEADLLKIDNWFGLGNNTSTIVNTVKTQLAENGRPVVIAMYGLESAFLNYTSGVYHYGGTYGVNGGHAMCIVGYDDSIEAFDVRNSWGGHWGDGGYWWCGYDAVVDLVSQGNRMDLYTMTAEFEADAVAYFLGDGIILDETEPNGSIDSANTLTPFPVEFYVGVLGSPDTSDYYSFEYEAGKATDFELSYDTGNGIASLELYDASETLLAVSSTGSGTEVLAGNWGSSGTAYLKVSLVSGEPRYSISGSERVPPDAPENVNATDSTRSDGVMITWDAVSGASFYKIKRADTVSGEYTELSTTGGSQYLDTSAVALTTYWYTVSALGFTGESLPGTVDSGRRSVPLVTGVSASDAVYADKVAITWDAVAGWTTYQLKRSMYASGPFDTVATIDATEYEDTSIDSGATYYYVVCLVSEGGCGPEGDADAGSTLDSGDVNEALEDESLQSNDTDTSGGQSLTDSTGSDQGSDAVPVPQ